MAINIGKRREPLWDYYIVDRDGTTATLSVNRFKREKLVYKLDAPWEGSEGFYPTVIRDGDGYVMYYGTQNTPKYNAQTDRLDESKSFVCRIESADGFHWRRTEVDKYTVPGCEHNNVVIKHESEPRDSLSVRVDTNPNCAEGERYKGILRVEDGCKVFKEGGTLASYVSADGIRFERGRDLLHEGGKFDSLNTWFYDDDEGVYKVFHRDFKNGLRSIRLRTSTDFVNWDDRGFIEFDDDEVFQLYTNNVRRYERAPHVYIGLPVRYAERGEWTENYDRLPDIEYRKRMLQSHNYRRLGLAMTDSLFMTSRDGLHWHKFNEAILDSGYEWEEEWSYVWRYGSNYLSHGYVDAGEKLYFYSIDRMYDVNTPAEIWAYSIRADGFASFKADYSGASVQTREIVFDGDELSINFRTSAAGSVYVTVCDEEGRSVKSVEMFGNNIDAKVPFDGSLSQFRGRPVRLRFDMRDAEIFSFKFN